MAEKEGRQKRLLIKEFDLVCDLTDCEHCEEKDWCCEKDSMTRQDAIKKVAKAIKENEGEGPKDLAKVALNALLGE